jgi:hypothetical protein
MCESKLDDQTFGIGLELSVRGLGQMTPGRTEKSPSEDCFSPCAPARHLEQFAPRLAQNKAG